MTVELRVAQLESALETNVSLRDSSWAYDRCGDTREIHEDVWERRPPRRYVKKKVIPLFKRTDRAVSTVRRAGPYVDYIEGFSRNTKARIRNLNNYVEGKPSDFAPDAKLEDVGTDGPGPGQTAEKRARQNDSEATVG